MKNDLFDINSKEFWDDEADEKGESDREEDDENSEIFDSEVFDLDKLGLKTAKADSDDKEDEEAKKAKKEKKTEDKSALKTDEKVKNEKSRKTDFAAFAASKGIGKDLSSNESKKPIKPTAALTAPLFVFVLFALLIGARYLDINKIVGEDSIYITMVVLQFLVLVIPAIFFCRIKGADYVRKLNIKLFSPGKLGFVIAAAIVMISGTTLIRLAQLYIFKRTDFTFSLYSYTPQTGVGGFNSLYLAIAFAIVPAVTEELIFRGIILTEYNYGGYGSVCAAVISSALFSMLHFSVANLAVYFFGGLILALVVYNTQSLLPAVITHMIYNLYILFAESSIIRTLTRPSSMVFLVFALALVFIVSLIVLLSEAERINYGYAVTGHPTPDYKLKRAEDGITPDVAASDSGTDSDAVLKKESFGENFRLVLTAAFSPTFLLCIVVFVVAALGLI